ncbi:MAG: Aldehyde dehydrogenase [Dehalococcoidia bacterium]|nr:Aldehyde dehydrogenase [Dehalococcoidia bacterium]
MIRVGINGFGRIGRAICRVNAEQKRVQIVAINDLNPDPGNMAYLLKYDSIYGRLERDVVVEGDSLHLDGQAVKLSHKSRIEEVPWEQSGVDVVVDATGAKSNVLAASKLIGRVKKVVITHSPKEVDHTIILGVNEETYDPKRHHVLSSSICDACAVAPVLKAMDEAFGLEAGFVTTLHPWLSYQNLMDGPAHGWADPEGRDAHYPVGRSSIGALIPKPTSVIEATERVLPHLRGVVQCMSYRVPTQIVGAANIYLRLSRSPTEAEVHNVFRKAEQQQRWPIFRTTTEPLTSVDFTKTEFSSIIDGRWTDRFGSQELFLALWYDNEWGYSHRVLDVISYALGRED